MIYIYLSGGLGNQLFQCCHGIQVSQQTNQPFKIVDHQYFLGLPGTRPLYWDTFFQNMCKYKWNGQPTFEEISQYPTITDENPDIPELESTQSLFVQGYFQAWKHIQSVVPQFISLLNLETQVQTIKDNVSIDFNTCIGMHFRRGDYVNQFKHVYHLLGFQYYKNALEHFDPSQFQTVLIYCEPPDWETGVLPIINRLKQCFPNFKFQRSKQKTDWEDLLSMSCCQGLITANSSFSYWAGLLPYNPSKTTKTVVYPKQWFTLEFMSKPHPGIVCDNSSDIPPPEWVQILDLD